MRFRFHIGQVMFLSITVNLVIDWLLGLAGGIVLDSFRCWLVGWLNWKGWLIDQLGLVGCLVRLLASTFGWLHG